MSEIRPKTQAKFQILVANGVAASDRVCWRLAGIGHWCPVPPVGGQPTGGGCFHAKRQRLRVGGRGEMLPSFAIADRSQGANERGDVS